MAGNIVSRMVFIPPRTPTYNSDLPGLFFIGVIPCVKYPVETPHPVTILYCHGNSEDLGTTAKYIKHLADTIGGVNIVAFDYEGYGMHSGRGGTSELSIQRDVELVHHYLVARTQSKIVIMGRSLGSGPAVHLAVKAEVAALILMSPIKSVIRVTSEITAVPFSFADIFKNLHLISAVRVPTLIIHGDCDNIVAHSHGRDLASLCSQEHLWKFVTVEGGTHNNDQLCKGEQTIGELGAFIDHVKAVGRL